MSVNYREVSRKAAVGERIKIVAAGITNGSYRNGSELTVRAVDGRGLYADGVGIWISDREYVVLEPVTSALTSDPLYAAFRQLIVDNADAIRAILPELEAAVIAPTPPKLNRAQVIAKATADVAELTRAVENAQGDSVGVVGRNGGRFLNVEFHVNREKRAVNVILRGQASGLIRAKFTAKCSPADVFHAEIGKAIALRKALGLMVPSEYTDAPQPEEPRVGMSGIYRSSVSGDHPTVLTKTHAVDPGQYGKLAFCHSYMDGWIGDKQFVILDDTDVDYSGVIAEGAAA